MFLIQRLAEDARGTDHIHVEVRLLLLRKLPHSLLGGNLALRVREEPLRWAVRGRGICELRGSIVPRVPRDERVVAHGWERAGDDGARVDDLLDRRLIRGSLEDTHDCADGLRNDVLGIGCHVGDGRYVRDGRNALDSLVEGIGDGEVGHSDELEVFGRGKRREGLLSEPGRLGDVSHSTADFVAALEELSGDVGGDETGRTGDEDNGALRDGGLQFGHVVLLTIVCGEALIVENGKLRVA